VLLLWQRPRWAFLGEDFDEAASFSVRRKEETTGRPVGSSEWLARMEGLDGLKLAAVKRGRKPAGERE
jgi:putative transposase